MLGLALNKNVVVSQAQSHYIIDLLQLLLPTAQLGVDLQKTSISGYIVRSIV
jgi:hypothetical protein